MAQEEQQLLTASSPRTMSARDHKASPAIQKYIRGQTTYADRHDPHASTSIKMSNHESCIGHPERAEHRSCGLQQCLRWAAVLAWLCLTQCEVVLLRVSLCATVASTV